MDNRKLYQLYSLNIYEHVIRILLQILESYIIFLRRSSFLENGK